MAESEEELKSFLIRVKEESKKSGLKLNIQKTNIMASGPIAAAAAELIQSCPTLWDPTDSSPPGSPVPGIPQARTMGCHFLLQCMKVKSERLLNRVRLLGTPQTSAYQAPSSMGFASQVYWSGVPSPSPITSW